MTSDFIREVHGLKKTKDTQYLYLSANIRAQENRMVGTQALHKMISAATPEEAYKTVTDAGIGVDVNYQDFESALTQELVSTYERLEKAAPDPEMFKIFRYKYDGHNLKTIPPKDCSALWALSTKRRCCRGCATAILGNWSQGLPRLPCRQGRRLPRQTTRRWWTSSSTALFWRACLPWPGSTRANS